MLVHLVEAPMEDQAVEQVALLNTLHILLLPKEQ
jgi:hypothetical protein